MSEPSERRSIFFDLRGLLGFVLLALLATHQTPLSREIWLLVFLFLLSNFVILFLPVATFRNPTAGYAVFFLDVAVLTVFFCVVSGIQTESLLLYYLTVFMATLGADLRKSVGIAVVAVALYMGIHLSQGANVLWNPQILMHVPLFFITAVSTGYLAQEVGAYRRRIKNLKDIQQTLESDLEVSSGDLTRSESKRVAAQDLARRFHDLVQGLDAIVWEADAASLLFVFVSRRAEEMLGYPAEQWVTVPNFWTDHIHPGDRERTVTSFRATLLAGKDHEFEYRMTASDGRVVWFRNIVRVIRDRSGRAIQVRGVMLDITKQKLAEERDLLFMLSLDMMCILGFDGYFKRLNPVWEKTLGYTREELQAIPFIDFVHPDDRELTLCEAEKLISGKRTISFENRYRTKDGSYKWFLWTAAPLIERQLIYGVARDNTDRKLAENEIKKLNDVLEVRVAERTAQLENAYLALQAEVTERKQAAEALRESEANYRDLVENSGVLIGTQDLEGTFLSANLAGLQIFGCEHVEELVGHKLGEYLAADALDQFKSHLQAVRKDGRAQTLLKVHTLKGEQRIIALDNSLRSEGLEKPLFRCIGRDITERIHAEEEMRQSEERTRLIIDTALDAVVTMDALGVITGWNAQAERSFGWTRKEAVGQRMSEILFPLRYREPHEQGLQHFLQSGECPLLNKRIEITALHRDGREIPVELAISPLKLRGVWTFSAFVRDITERKRADVELHKAKEAAEAANRAKSEFLAIMSHEIRTPMNGIIGMTELALDTPLNPEQREFLGMVKSSADSLLTVINDILDFSKIEAGKLDIEVIEVNLRSSLAHVIKTLALRAHEKKLELAYQFHPDVPRVLLGDPGRLRQIVINLVGNAIKFTERGEVVVRVKPESMTENTVILHYSVSDTGIGVSSDKQKLIFEPFSQSDSSTTRKYGGTGLGLAISARLVRMMGGRIWVESETAKGSTFHFTVPFKVPKEMAARPGALEPFSLRGLHALVVDDNATNRRILEEMLTNWHMKPTLADGGLQALACLERARDSGSAYPLVLLDAQMQDMDGFTLAERIKQSPELAPATIMMLTSAGQRGDGARCRDLGISAYLTKPIRQSDLLDAIITVTGKFPGKSEPVPLVTRHSLRESQRHFNILLAEDNAVNQTLAVRLLEKHGHSVVVTGNGREALATFENSLPGEFDLLLMDVQMPEMDGFEVTAAIREMEKTTALHVPILAMTANAMQGDREICLHSGMDGYVSKPVQVEELLMEIERLVPSTFGEPGGTNARHEDGGLIDRAAVLDCLGGNSELLAEMAGLFLQEYPRLLTEIRQAGAHNDGKALERSAHQLRGSVGNFTTGGAAYEAARRLEGMGRENNFSHAEEACVTLEKEMENFNSALEDMRKR